jgi:lysophospholipase L1-like esterase
MNVRILIVTDSLGMPRENIPVKDTWVERLMSSAPPVNIWYVISRRSLTIKNIAFELLNEIKLLSPDVLIIQAGICDCCRRALSLRVLRLISHIRFIRGIIHRIVAKYHYYFTCLYCVRYTTVSEFRQSLKKITSYIKEKRIRAAFIRIADPGDALVKRVYDCKHDIDWYNHILERSLGDDIPILNPYFDHDVKEYILEEDGHHLSILGNEIVSKTVLSWLKSL